MTVDADFADTTNGAPLEDKEKKTLLAIRKLRRELERHEYKQREPIAIVGLSCRVPGARDAEEFWALLDGGVDAIREVPPERWDIDAYYDPDPDAPGKVYTRWAGYVDGIEDFDAAFFGISPREAEFMDPQQRLLLEQAWCALEHAGIAPSDLYGTRTGVFVGVTASDYAMMILEAGIEPGPYYVTGNTLNVAAGRLSYVLRLQGPCMAIDTACSSSLVAVHQSCISLRNGESDVALAGGVNLLISPQSTIATCRARMLSADGRCKTFDSRADGYARGEGCGMVVLKRLSDAERDRDHVLAVIRGSAVNQDGRSSGLTVPNGPAQERVIADALRVAGLKGSDVQYLEAHGTGTSLGDPIEVQAAAHALGGARTAKTPLLLGSAKTNIGHLEAAAGIVGLIKVVLSLQHERLPRHLHFHEPNPHIAWSELPVEVLAEARAWPRGERPRIAGVSSFGFSGTNAHVVLEEARAELAVDEAAKAPVEREQRLLVLSGRTAPALQQSAAEYRAWLERHEEARLADVCFTANTGRNHFEHRGALVFASAERLREQLAALGADGVAEGLHVGARAKAKPKVGFLFTGQGAQYIGMGRRLYETEPVYREHFDRCAVEFARLRSGEPDLRDVVFEEGHRALLDQTGYTQPALFALEVSLAALWRSWGVEPAVVLGHSVGEYSAACVAGSFSVEAGVALIAERSRLMQVLPLGGAMAAIQGKADVIEARVAEAQGVDIGARNGANVVISGAEPALCAVIERLTEDGCRCTRLKTSHAFHSALMDPMLEPFRAFADGVDYRAPHIKLISNVSGRVMESGTIPDAAYWTEHVRAPVRFADGVEALAALGCEVVLEVGPHPVLTTMAQQCWAAREARGDTMAEPAWIGSLRRERDDQAEVLGAAAALFVAGAELDFAAMEGAALAHRRRLALPSYPFQRQRYWVEIPESARVRSAAKLEDCVYRTVWERKDVVPAAPPEDGSANWLLVSDEGGTGTAVRRELEAHGERCVCLDIGAEGALTAEALGERITAAQGSEPFQFVLHLASLDRPRADSVEDLRRAQERGVESVLALVQALARREWKGRLWLVTRGVQRVLESDGVEPTQSPMWGLGKVIGMEQPWLWGGLVDLPLETDAATSARELVSACAAADAEDHVALRGGSRWVARLVPDKRPARAALKLDGNATYLITGGLGDIGLAAARRLVERGARHLVLSSRSAPSEAAAAAIGELRERGCEVRVIAADLSREEEVVRLFNEMAHGELPPLGGLIHAAGVGTLVTLDELDREQLHQIMAAKVYGAWLLDRIVAERAIELAFFVCTSSIASVWGSVMQAAYAAGNAFLDALSERRVLQGRAASALNYGPWAQVDSGMSSKEGLAWLRSRGIRALQPAFALDAMEAVVSAGLTGTTIANIDWPLFRELAEVQRQRPLLEYLGAAAKGDSEALQPDGLPPLLEELRAVPEAERVQRLTEVARREVAQVLRVRPEDLEPDVSFFTLGMDSLMAIEAINRLRRCLGNNALSVQLLFEQPTIRQLAATLTESLDLAPPPAAAARRTEGRGTGDEARDDIEWPASIGQERVWFLQQWAPTSPQFNLSVALRFEKGIRPELLERVLRDLMLRHDALRTTLEIRNGNLRQIVRRWLMPVLRVVDLGEHPHAEAQLQKVQEEEAGTLFDLVHGPLIRFTLVNRNAAHQVLLITIHHAISDGVSLRVLLDEFLVLQEAFAKNEESPLPAPEAQFSAYAVYERQRLGSRRVQDDVTYWREELRGIPPLELPSDRVRPAVQTHAGDKVRVVLSTEMLDRVHKCSRITGVTPFVTLLAAWTLLLSRYSGQSDFGIGTPVAGRDGPEWSHVVGLFLNMVTLRVQLNQDWTARELLAQVEAVIRRDLAHQALPFDWLVGQINPPRDPSRTPLFQAALILQVPKHDFQARVDVAGVSIADLRLLQRTAQYDITLDLEETSTGFRGFLEYNSDLFDRWRVEQMARHFEVLLLALTSQLDTPISKLPLLSVDEQQRLLTAWNQSARNYPMDRCVHEHVAEQARRNPRKTAVVCGKQRLTYRELNRKANQLAHYLRRRRVGANTLVGLCLDRSVDMVVGMLGVMKAGGAYLPLDPDFPKHRLEQMLDDARAPVLVSQTALLDRLPELDAAVVCVDRDGDGIAMEPDSNPEHGAKAEDPAYVIYTSGSTGKPKGVVITHRSLLNFLISMAEETAFTSREVMVAVTTLSFDISGLELLLPLLQGACTVIATLEETRDVQLLRKVLRDNEATIMQATPATWRMLLASGWTNPERIRVLCGGEAMRQDLAKGLLDVTDFLWNVYGPTETTIWSTIQMVREAQRPTVSLGKPLANTQLYLLDDYLQPVPNGVPGELFIGGDGVAKEYLNQPELTAERFIPDPFGKRAGARLYRTGDLCLRLPDGTVEFLGRRDHQVKVRGFRIEIGDVEAAMAACPGIRQAAVTTWKGPDGFDFLAGYLVADHDHRPALDALKASLRETLPAYMIPGMLMFLDELPLTPNKKVDRRALPSPQLVREQAQNEYVAPRTEAEKTLAEVWKKVLGVERVGIRDNFFDLGGHSLLIVQILSTLRQHYNVEMSIVELYQNATVESLADYLEQRIGSKEQSAASDATSVAAGGRPTRDQTHQHRTKDGLAYTARRYREGDRAGAIASFEKAFGPRDANVLSAVFNWKYLEHPLASADDPPAIVIECDGYIVGMDGGVRARFKIGEETMSGSWATDTHVAPDHRAITGWALATGIRHSSRIAFSMPNANSYPILSAAKAVIDVDRFTDLKACLDLGSVLKMRGFNPLLSSICGLAFLPVPRAFDLYASLRAESGITIAQIPRFDTRFDELWRVASRDYPGIMVRDQAFLSWRFDRCPNRDYTRYVAERNGALVGYMVTRETRWKGALRGRIVDYFVGLNDSAAFDSLVRAVMEDFKSRRAVSIFCSISSTQSEQIRRLRQHGFLFRNPGPRVVVGRGPWEEKLTAIKSWFFTYADADIDYNKDESET